MAAGTKTTKKPQGTAKKATPAKTKNEKTKEQKIAAEKRRLRGIFKELEENKRKLVTPIIEKNFLEK